MTPGGEAATLALVHPILRIQRILWAALFASTIVFFLVPQFVPPAPLAEPVAAELPWLLAAIGLVQLVLSFWLPARVQRQNLEKAKCEVVEVPDPDMPAQFRERAKPVRVFADPERARTAALTAQHTAVILRSAFREVHAVYGFVLYWLGFPLEIAIPFYVVSWITMPLAFPREAPAIALLERVYGVKTSPGRQSRGSSA